MGNLCCAREHSFQIHVQFFYTVKLHSLTDLKAEEKQSVAIYHQTRYSLNFITTAR
jgi:hypothetical protein